MIKKSNTSIYHKLYQLTKKMYQIVHNMPKEYKYTLGEDLLKISWQCLDVCMKASTSPRGEKGEEIHKLSVVFDRLKLRIRMMQEVGLISEGQFASLQENYLLPTGKMIGGWYNWEKKR